MVQHDVTDALIDWMENGMAKVLIESKHKDIEKVGAAAAAAAAAAAKQSASVLYRVTHMHMHTHAHARSYTPSLCTCTCTCTLLHTLTHNACCCFLHVLFFFQSNSLTRVSTVAGMAQDLKEAQPEEAARADSSQ